MAESFDAVNPATGATFTAVRFGHIHFAFAGGRERSMHGRLILAVFMVSELVVHGREIELLFRMAGVRRGLVHSGGAGSRRSSVNRVGRRARRQGTRQETW